MLAIAAPLNACLGIVNPLSGPDHEIASWFHSHLSHALVSVLRAFSEFGDAESIGIALGCIALFFAWKRWWPSLVTLVVVVPGGMLLNEWLKILVHRHRPFVEGWFVDWSGYSFASGHTIGATLLYGQVALFLVPVIQGRRGRVLLFSVVTIVVALVGFSRIALGAHYFTDVLAGIFFGSAWLTFCFFASRPFRRINFPPAIESVLPEVTPELVPVPVPVQANNVVPPTPPNSLI